MLIDFLTHDPEFGTASRDALRSCAGEGPLLAYDVVWAEIAGCFPSILACRDALRELEIEFSPLQPEAAFEVGVAWKAYRQRGAPVHEWQRTF